MIAWERRTPELANLLNPAFTALLIRDAVGAYAKARGVGMNLPIALLVLPIILHKPSREMLPKKVSKFHIWVQSNQEVRIGLAERARSLAPFSKEAILFAMQQGTMDIDENGLLLAMKSTLTNGNPSYTSEETASCRERATFLGRWFGGIEKPSSIFTAFGLSL